MTPRYVIRRWRDDINRVLERWWPSHPPATAAHSTAAVDEVVFNVEETNEALIVLADLPGLKPGDCTVEATTECLVIWGELKLSAAHGDRNCSITERHYGAFTRTLPLPCDVDPDKACATYDNGVLQITLPKTTRITPIWVQINVQEAAR
jgi:HSP20 family protein